MTEPEPRWSLPGPLAERPVVRVNQLGYRSDGPKRATWISDLPDAVEFTALGPGGHAVFRGRTRPWLPRPEPTSGLPVHVLDFSPVRGPDAGFTIVVGADRSHPFPIGTHGYQRLSRDALRFFTLLRSGYPIDDRRFPGYARPAGHVGQPPNTGDTAVPAWRGPDAGRLYPGWSPPGTFDVSGGWYDAGDYGKYVVSGAIALWQLLNVVALLPSRAAADRTAAVLDECRWQLDWMLRMQVPTGRPLAGMAFHRVHGTRWSPLPGLPHRDPTTRVLHRPSTAATLHLAAVAAQGARVFRPVDPAYAERLLAAARRAHRAAHTEPVLIAPDDHGAFGGGPYGDDQLADDAYFAAAQLWLATGDKQFLTEIRRSPEHIADVFDPSGFDFDRVAAPARLDLAAVDSTLPDHTSVRASVLDAADTLLRLQRAQPWGQPYAPPGGWDWGSNGRILNNLVVLATAHLITGRHSYRDAVVSGVDYLFGRNALGQSYVTGYGVDHTRHLRTRLFGHDLDPLLPTPPDGALAGGANSTHHPGFPGDERLAGLPPQCHYLDEPSSETTNDVCIRWNAPLVWIASYLADGGSAPRV